MNLLLFLEIILFRLYVIARTSSSNAKPERNLKICNKTQKKCQSEAGLDDKFGQSINHVSKCVIPTFLEKS